MLEMDGKRFLPWMEEAAINYEHLHRYRFAREFVKGKKVLDLACGEGYGSFMLSEDAMEVVGVDIDEATIRHASSKYLKENLKFIKGSIIEIPIEGEKIFDVIVCFEALEHIEEHDELMREVKRLLKDDGIFIVSTPNKYIYSDQPSFQNPFHLKELYFDEFKVLLNNNFKNTLMYGQKVYPSSNIFPVFRRSATTKDYVIEKGDRAFLFVPSERKEARYFFAVSSNSPIKEEAINSHLLDISEALFKQQDGRIASLETAINEKEVCVSSLQGTLREKETHIVNLERQREENYRDWQARVGNLEKTLQDKERYIQNLEQIQRDKVQHMQNLEAVVRDKQGRIESLELALKDKETQIGSLESALKDKETHIQNLEAIMNEKEATLNYIYHSYGLGALWVCNKTIDKLFPHNSKRRLFAKIVLNTIKSPKAILKTLSAKNAKLFLQYLKKAHPAILEERADTLIFKQAILMYCDRVLFEPENIEIAGWAISSRGIEKIEVYCDHRLLGHASYGLPRPDVHALYSFVPNSVNSGFHFSKLLEQRLSQGQHTLLIKAIGKDGRSVEVVYPADVADAYLNYLTRTAPTESVLRWMRETSKDFLIKPHISLALVVKEETLPFLNRSLDSIKAQSYPFWEIKLFYENDPIKDISNSLKPFIDESKLEIYPIADSGKSLIDSKGEFLCFIHSGDILAPNALFEIVKRINMDDTLDLIYSDEDTLVGGERKEFFFKPDWSPDLLFSMNYIGQFFLLRKNLFAQIGGLYYGFSAEGMYDLLLRATERTKQIGHVSLVLYTKGHRLEHSPQFEKKIIEESLSRRGIKGDVDFLPLKGTYRVRRAIIGSPKVSIIIPTTYRKPDLLRACLRSVAEKSTYTNYEILLVDHSYGKLPEEELKQLFPTSVLQFLKYKESFDFSRMNNLAVKKATGDYLIFLNDDTEVIAPEWIEAMLEHAQRPEVGMVGAKLLYQDNTIQHAGVFLVDRPCGGRHAFRFLPNESDSYWGFAGITRNCSAVTFACVMVSRKNFSNLGGFDERLRVEYNDIDFCLRAIEAGYLVVWTPFCLLYHAELTSREPISFGNDHAYFLKRWRTLLEKGDSYYNPNLTLNSDDFSLNVRSDGFGKLVTKEASQHLVFDTKTSEADESFIRNNQIRPHVRKKILEERIMIDDDSHVSVIIPTFNGAKDLAIMLPKLMSQRGLKSVEIVTIDSGSSDRTVEVCRKNGAKVIEITQEEFSHSFARNLGAENAISKYLLFMVQDALPSSDLFIYNMLCSLKKHSAIAASCGEFLRMDVDFFGEVQQWGHYRFLGMDGDDKMLSLPEEADYTNLRRNSQLSDVACLIETNVFLQYKYRNDYAEDLDLGLRLIRDKYRLVYVNTTKVIHSHTRPAYYILKRSLVDNTVLSKLFPDFPRPKVHSKMFCEDIVFVYGLIEEIVSKGLMGLATPSKSGIVRDIVIEYLDRGFTRRYALGVIIEDTLYADSRFSSFIRTINSQYDPKYAKLNYHGKLLADVKSYANMAFDYLLQTSETIDDYRKKDIASCLYKILAIVIGTQFAFYDYNENLEKRDFFVQLRNELERGV